MEKPKLVIVEGCDNSGKSTFIKRLEEIGYIKLDIPKKTKMGSILKVDTEESLTPFVEMFKYIKDGNYVLDRSVMSNAVYEKILHNKNSKWFNMHYLLRMGELTNLSVVVLDRNPIMINYSDDLIDLDKIEFNSIIEEYKSLYQTYKDHAEFHQSSIKFIIDKILNHDSLNQLMYVDEQAISRIIDNLKED